MQSHLSLRGCRLPSGNLNLSVMFILSTYHVEFNYTFYLGIQEHHCTIEHTSQLKHVVLA